MLCSRSALCRFYFTVKVATPLSLCLSLRLPFPTPPSFSHSLFLYLILSFSLSVFFSFVRPPFLTRSQDLSILVKISRMKFRPYLSLACLPESKLSFAHR